jgi:hypothetical protein
MVTVALLLANRLVFLVTVALIVILAWIQFVN